MVEMTVTLPNQLADRLRPMVCWLPTVLELSLQGFKTPAVQTVSEIIVFLSSGPTPKQVAAFMVSIRAQEHLSRLLALNKAGLLSPMEQDELDELEQLEHIILMLKAQARKQILEHNDKTMATWRTHIPTAPGRAARHKTRTYPD